MFDYLERLKRLPRHQRKTFALMTSFIVTGIIVLIWVSVLILGDGLGHYRFDMDSTAVPPLQSTEQGWQNLHRQSRQTEEGTSWEAWIAEQDLRMSTTSAPGVVPATASPDWYGAGVDESMVPGSQASDVGNPQESSGDPFDPTRLTDPEL